MLDLNMACCGFLYALDVADSYFRAGKATKALVISAEGMSRLLDWSDRSTCVLFGDGAGAAVLEPGDGLLDIRLTVSPASSIFRSAHAAAYPRLRTRATAMRCG